MSEGDGLRFDPTVNLGHLISLAGIAAAMVTGWVSLSNRLESVERQLARQTIIIEASIRQEEQLKILRETINGLQARIEALRK
jgi:hypothetical protein